MSGNDSSDDDLVMGRTNHAQDPTRLFANEDGHSWGDDVGDPTGPVLDVSTGETPASNAIHATANGVHPAIWASGLWTGILAECEVHGPNGKAIQGLAGTWGTGVYGFSGSGKGVWGDASYNEGTGTGVQGTGKAGNGLAGESESGDGVAGHSVKGRGGTFSSDRIAQLHLTPRFSGGLPCIGQAGDLLMYSPQAGADEEDPTEQGNASLWLCIKSSANDDNAAEQKPAVWARFQFDIVLTCKEGVPPTPPKHSRGVG